MFNFQWHITDRCNLRCLHCYQSDYSKGADTGFLLAVAEKIIHELELKNYTTCINLTGGEPLLEKKSLLTLLDFLNQNPRVQELMIITNGLLLDDAYLKELKRFPKLTTIKLSLEGATAATNDFIRGEGTYDAITQKIRLLKSYQQFYAVLMFTLQKRNFPEIESMFALSETLNLDGLILERFIPEGRGKKLRDFVLDKNDWKELLQKLIRYYQLDTTPQDLLIYRAFWIQFHPEFDILGAPCNLNEALCIMPDGTLYPCRRFIYPLGNVLQDGIWAALDQSKLLQEITDNRNLKGKCHSCSIQECHGCRALSYALTQDPYSEDYQCFLE